MQTLKKKCWAENKRGKTLNFKYKQVLYFLNLRV